MSRLLIPITSVPSITQSENSLSRIRETLLFLFIYILFNNVREFSLCEMGEAFRSRIANDPDFAIEIKEPEKLCPYSDRLLEQEDPMNGDHANMIKIMTREEFKQHVRDAQQLQLDDQQKEKEKG